MKTLVKIVLTTLLMGTGLAIAEQTPNQATGATTSPVQMQNMGSMMGMMQNMMGMMHQMMGTMQTMSNRNTMMAHGGGMMGQGSGMTGQAGMMGGRMASNQNPSPKQSMKNTACDGYSHQQMDPQKMMNVQQASQGATG